MGTRHFVLLAGHWPASSHSTAASPLPPSDVPEEELDAELVDIWLVLDVLAPASCAELDVPLLSDGRVELVP